MGCITLPGCIICGVPDAYGEAVVNGRKWRWEFVDSIAGGPGFLRKDGELLKNQNPPTAVWDAFQKWLKAYYAAKKKKKCKCCG